MSDISLNNVTSGYNLSKINANFQILEDAHNDVAAWVSGGNNTWQQDIDLNSNNLINANSLSTKTLVLNGNAVVASDLGSFAPGSVGTVQIIDNSVTDPKIVSVGGGKVTYNQIGAGAITRFIQDGKRDLSTVTDFAAVGDASTDNTTAFINHQTAKGYLVVTPGSYRIASSLNITVPIYFYPGAMLLPDTGVTISISGPIVAEDHQIFSKALGGNISLSGSATKLKMAWFGVNSQNSATLNTAGFGFCLASVPVSDGCHITWPSGQINIFSCTHSISGVAQRGSEEGTWLINNTTNLPALEAASFSTFNNTFSNFRIGQAVGVTPVAGNCGVRCASQQSKVYDIHCFSFPAPLFDGVFIDAAIGLWLERCLSSSLINNGFHFGGGCGDIFVNSLYSTGNAQNGYYFNGMSGLYGQNLNGFGNNTSCFYFDNSGHVNGSGTINEFIFATNWVGDTSGGSNYNILNLSESTFTNCWGSTQKSAAVNTFACGFNITSSGCNDIGFTNCQALTNNGDGFLVDQGATNIRFNSCKARANGRGGNAGVNNGFHLGLGAAVTNVTITGCRAYGNVGGIFLGAFASDYCVIALNNNQGNSGATLVNNSTGTHNVVVNNT